MSNDMNRRVGKAAKRRAHAYRDVEYVGTADQMAANRSNIRAAFAHPTSLRGAR
jgi:hypothetical protein